MKIKKVKVDQSAMASFFEVHDYSDGYSGLQQTEDTQFGTPFISIFSMWDPDTQGGIFADEEYIAPGGFHSRFGGEGDGQKTIHPFAWNTGIWYNFVIRAWKASGKLFVANFIKNESTGVWLHTSTIAAQDEGGYLRSNSNSFLENWWGVGSIRDGRHIRKAFFKDAYIMEADGTWHKNYEARVSVNGDSDAVRNGIYHNAFNAAVNTSDNSYMVQHGGSSTASPGFTLFGGNNDRVLFLGPQLNQPNIPVLPSPIVDCLQVNVNNGVTTVLWEINQTRNPQLKIEIEVLTANGQNAYSIVKIQPELRQWNIPLTIAQTDRVIFTMTDIFDQSIQLSRDPIFGNIIHGAPSVAGSISSGTYVSPNIINTGGEVSQNANVTVISENRICLTSGFNVNNGKFVGYVENNINCN